LWENASSGISIQFNTTNNKLMFRRFISSFTVKEKRAELWVVFISATFISCVVGGPCNDSSLAEVIVMAMFADMGVTVLKNTKVIK
jgi:hypothetical protein